MTEETTQVLAIAAGSGQAVRALKLSSESSQGHKSGSKQYSVRPKPLRARTQVSEPMAK